MYKADLHVRSLHDKTRGVCVAKSQLMSDKRASLCCTYGAFFFVGWLKAPSSPLPWAKRVVPQRGEREERGRVVVDGMAMVY